MRGLGGWPAAAATRVERSTLDAFKAAIDFALRERVDGVFLAGDLYDRRDRSLRARLHLQRQLERLGAAGIPSYLVHGNHDPLTADDAAVPLPPLTTVFGAGWSEVDSPGGRFRVQGISYVKSDVDDNLAQRFHRTSAAPSIGLLHTNVAGSEGHLNYAPCTVADLARAGLDYWALGHVHTRQTFQAGAGLAAYPGNLQGRHVRETGPRGGLLVELDDALRVRAEVRFVPFDLARWHVLRVDVSAVESIDDALASVLLAAAGAVDDAPQIHTNLFRIVLAGASPLHRELARRETQQTLEDRLAERFAPRDWLLESLQVETGLKSDLPSLLAAGGLVADVAHFLEAPVSQADLDGLWAAAGLEALDDQLAAARLDSLERRSIFQAAVTAALGHLLEEPS